MAAWSGFMDLQDEDLHSRMEMVNPEVSRPMQS
jgi:hypothetical protein